MGVVHLEKMENFASTLNNKRRAKLPLPPRTFEEIRTIPTGLFPEQFVSTAAGKPWLILNTSNEDNDELILGFASPSQLSLMKTAKVIYMDGTFSIVSGIDGALQLYDRHLT